MNLQNWARDARANWKEFLPNRYKEFEEAGVLNKALMTAAKQTARDMGSFQDAGLTWDQAWERTRNEYLFLPPEPKQKAKQDREPSPNAAAQAFGPSQAFQGEILRRMKDGAQRGGPPGNPLKKING